MIIKMAIYKTRNTGMGNGMRGIQGTRGMFTRIPGNVLILAFREMFEKIPGNFIKESGKCLRRFRGMLLMIPGNALEDSGECSRFWKIPENVECSIRRQCSGCREQTLFF